MVLKKIIVSTACTVAIAAGGVMPIAKAQHMGNPRDCPTIAQSSAIPSNANAIEATHRI
ncbi:hypothetical protein [Phormidium sp. CCY1219]|uniref:hypothetical protein n=1 Tax=Phormidium sp. CCY1219 TaxID=2886104 RepID=UPI002D1E72B3|nr:hypothetical protein [Phormidium sp. CCY1219]MEB3828294.1 hypothetical protein [Phormidium sp. CCY1219]